MDQEPKPDQKLGEEYSNTDLTSKAERLTSSLSSVLDGFGDELKSENGKLEFKSEDGKFYSAYADPEFGTEISIWYLNDNGKLIVKNGSIVSMDRLRIRYSESEFNGSRVRSSGDKSEIEGNTTESVNTSARREHETFTQPKEKLSIVGARIEGMIEDLRQQAPQK
jgi:hypothetical protein